MITFQAAPGGSFDQVVIPLHCQNLHTSYFRLHSGCQPPSDAAKRFAFLAWEVLSMFKENFPSKVLLF